jgi:hypothetical protein
MKKKHSKYRRFTILTVLLIMMISSCKKEDGGNNVSPTNTGPLSIEFSQNLSYDYGWVVLYDISGTTITDYKKFEVGETVDFLNTSDKVSISMVLVDTTFINGILSSYIRIYSYLEAPAGDWTMSAYYNDNIGFADVTIQYPEDEYNIGIISTSSFISERSDIPTNELNILFGVNELQENQKFSIYGTVYKDNIGYYNWAMDQDFQPGQVNNYNIELNKLMSKKLIEFNKPVSNLYLNGYYDGRQSLYRLYSAQSEGYQGNSNIGMLLIPDIHPMSEIRVSAYSHDYPSDIAYSNVYDGFNDIPENIQFPDNSISANYDETDNAIANIQVSGTGDMIIGAWSYLDFQNDQNNFIFCDVYADITHNILYRPVLPQQITNELGDIMNKLKINSVNLIDYNTTENLSDFIYLFYIDDIPVYSMSDHFFANSYYFNQTIAKDPRHLESVYGPMPTAY